MARSTCCRSCRWKGLRSIGPLAWHARWEEGSGPSGSSSTSMKPRPPPHAGTISPTCGGAATTVSPRAWKTPLATGLRPAKLDPRKAVAVGAHSPIVAFNAYLDTDDVEVARAIAREVRARWRVAWRQGARAGGWRQGAGLDEPDGPSEDLDASSSRSREVAALEHEASVESTELVGLAPLEAVLQTAAGTTWGCGAR